MRIASLSLGVLSVVVACSRISPEEAGRREFAKQFVASVQADSEFYRHYTDEKDVEQLRHFAAPRISGPFHVSHAEHYEDGSHEYAGTCGVNVKCLVFVEERNGRIVKASAIVRQK